MSATNVHVKANTVESVQAAIGIAGFIAESDIRASEAIAGLMIVLLAAVRPDLGMRADLVGPFITDLTTAIANWAPPNIPADFIPEVPGGLSNAN
jgi:hypothetical protein